jgi:hypothetical protein
MGSYSSIGESARLAMSLAPRREWRGRPRESGSHRSRGSADFRLLVARLSSPVNERRGVYSTGSLCEIIECAGPPWESEMKTRPVKFLLREGGVQGAPEA